MSSFALLALALTAQDASAGRGGRGGGGGASADLETTLSLPAAFDVDVSDTVSITVENVGNGSANSVVVDIDLPETNTSPTVHVMGDLDNIDSACVQSGTTLSCSLGRLKAGRSATVSFDIALPQSAGSLDFSATASTTSTDSNASNNADDDSAVVLYPDLAITSQAFIINRHCTGQGLEAFYECELYPSSISSHEIILETDGSITFSQAGYSGAWGQDTDDHLWFEYYYAGMVRLTFEGNAVDGDCFEGLTDFPGTSYVAPYEVCIK